MSSEPKARSGNFFEDFSVGQEIVHATPRTVTEGEVALYTALFGGRFAVNSSDPFAGSLGLGGAPVDSMLAFHIVFGKTVPDISLNAIANLGYANGRFGVPVFTGDTLSTTSTVIGVKQNRDGTTGVVYVRSIGANQVGEMVLDYVRWVMVRKRNADAPAPTAVIPTLEDSVDVAALYVNMWNARDGSVAASSTAATSSASPGRCRSTDSPMRSVSRPSTAVGTPRRPSPATRSTPGPKSSTSWSFRTARTSGPCASGPWQ